MNEGDIEVESRRAIYQEIADSPGIHFRALLDTLPYAQGTLQYHLRQLADEDLIDVSDDGKYTRYYPAADFDEAEQTVMNALRREYSRRILAHLLADGPLSTTDLSDRLDKAQSTVSWHLSKLADADLVTKERDGRRVVYDVENPDRVKYLYTIHQQSFTDRVVDRLLGLWEGY
ncbi:ArsR family transcription regulator [Halobacterium hubeiense]|uniref:ArsR family transcription regulator n=1 Tax=Halobacterium hubeiense TaxID=1407499 RepID=A0A0U5CZ94_9EURY|nr:metalloregulator ArsR/SmtB family transcription factor [Halobacterium hubeiense]CQH58898.1 ArsR family transcription regulator [Halobacterium hubeiense]